ncbi:MAG: PH domain-containing protein [Spirochaetales bacterium]|nr:PH domain-containing protein [Spirochaetales bacterium]
MINFNVDSVFNLVTIPIESIRKEVDGFLVDGEYAVEAFRTVRDQLIFTNMRIISIDVQGLTGMRKSFTSMPYSKIQFFTVQTPGFLEVIADTELDLLFSNGFKATFEIKGKVDIGKISRVISTYVLG